MKDGNSSKNTEKSIARNSLKNSRLLCNKSLSSLKILLHVLEAVSRRHDLHSQVASLPHKSWLVVFFPLDSLLGLIPPTCSLFSQKQPQVYLVGIESTDNFITSSKWYCDSGATHHVTNNTENFLDNISTFGSDQVMLGNGQDLSITSIGSTYFQFIHSPLVTLNLENFLLVPKITKNLILVSQFARDNNVFFDIHPGICLVKSQGSSEILLQGALGKDGLYSFRSLQVRAGLRQWLLEGYGTVIVRYYQEESLLGILTLLTLC